jgi:hypothetical protein
VLKNKECKNNRTKRIKEEYLAILLKNKESVKITEQRG